MDIFSRAKVFIENMGEFVPFVSKSISGIVKSVVYAEEADENDSDDSEEGINILKSNFQMK